MEAGGFNAASKGRLSMRVLDREPVDKQDVRHMDDLQLKQLGIRLLDQQVLTLQCLTCSHTWTPQLDSDGKLPFNYWLCPAQCNG
jgi:hypothetical protein